MASADKWILFEDRGPTFENPSLALVNKIPIMNEVPDTATVRQGLAEGSSLDWSVRIYIVDIVMIINIKVDPSRPSRKTGRHKKVPII